MASTNVVFPVIVRHRSFTQVASTVVKMLLVQNSTVQFNENSTSVTGALSGLTECDALNYARQTCTSVTLTHSTANNRLEVYMSQVDFPNLGSSTGGTNNTLNKYLSYVHNSTDDALNLPLAGVTFSAVTTNGSTSFGIKPSTSVGAIWVRSA